MSAPGHRRAALVGLTGGDAHEYTSFPLLNEAEKYKNSYTTGS